MVPLTQFRNYTSSPVDMQSEQNGEENGTGYLHAKIFFSLCQISCVICPCLRDRTWHGRPRNIRTLQNWRSDKRHHGGGFAPSGAAGRMCLTAMHIFSVNLHSGPHSRLTISSPFWREVGLTCSSFFAGCIDTCSYGAKWLVCMNYHAYLKPPKHLWSQIHSILGRRTLPPSILCYLHKTEK